MLGCSLILYDRTGLLNKLKQYTLDMYKDGLPKLDNEEIMEYISIINNRIEKLKNAFNNDDGNFYNLYHLTIKKIRRFYHSINGYPMINTSKIYKMMNIEKHTILGNLYVKNLKICILI